jgi:hypothetical protein
VGDDAWGGAQKAAAYQQSQSYLQEIQGIDQADQDGGRFHVLQEHLAAASRSSALEQQGTYSHKTGQLDRFVHATHRLFSLSPQEDNQLLSLIKTLTKEAKVKPDEFKVNWGDFAKDFPGRSAKQCRDRWMNYLRPGLKKGDWTTQEERIIMGLHREIGSK